MSQPAPTKYEGFCPIEPFPKGRPRFARQGKFVHTYPDKKTEEYCTAVRKWFMHDYGKDTEPMDGDLYCRLEFVLPRPSSTKKTVWYKNTKGDIDNYTKAFLDAMDFKKKHPPTDNYPDGYEEGVLFNDSRISVCHSVKRYADENKKEPCGTKFTIEQVELTVILHNNNIPIEIVDQRYRLVYMKEELPDKPDKKVKHVIVIGARTDKQEIIEKIAKNNYPNADIKFLTGGIN